MAVKKMRKFNQKKEEESKSELIQCKCAKPRDFNDPDSDTCGKFCRYLNSEEQKELIFKKADAIWANSGYQIHNFVVPAEWWRVWCDYVNIEYKSLQEHFKDRKVNISDASKWAEKEPLSTLKITEESEVEFDIRTFRNDGKSYLNSSKTHL